jgi:curved DNA-binding protein CbpA
MIVMRQEFDPWEVLGVSPGASQEEIKKAWREKVKKTHPDLNPHGDRGPRPPMALAMVLAMARARTREGSTSGT